MADLPISITLKDTASAALGAAGEGAAKTLDSVRDAAAKTGRAFEIMGNIASGLNAGLEIAKKGFELFRTAILDTVTTALEFRDANDPVIKQFDDMKRSVELLRARLGDVLIPVLQAVALAFQPILEGNDQWLRSNRKLIASGIIDFLGKTATLLTKGVAASMLLVSKAWTGWQLIIEGVKEANAAMFGVIIRGIELTIKGMRLLAEITGTISPELRAAEEAAAFFAEGFEDAANDSANEMFRIQAAQAALEAATEKTAKAVEDAIRGAVVGGQKIVRESIEGTTKSIEEQNVAAAALDVAQKERDVQALERLKEFQRALNEAAEQSKLREEDAFKLSAELQARREALAGRVADSFGEATTKIIQGFAEQGEAGEDAAERIGKATISGVLDIIGALTAEAAAAILTRAIEALPFPAGIIVGTVAAAGIVATFAAIRASVTQGFAEGGFVRGGTPGRDSVPILAQEGEFVMSRSDVMGFRKFASKILGSSSGEQLAQVGRRSGEAITKAGDLTENTTIINRFWFPNRIEEMRMSRRQAIAQNRLRSLGMMPEGA